MKKKVIIHTHKLMGFLVMKGFVLLGIEPDKRNPYHHVYVFNDTEEIQKAIQEYKPFMEQYGHLFIRDIKQESR
jgi:hypothetical protein